MTNTITIVDYGMGNLYSVTRAFEKCGARVVVTSNPDAIAAAGRLVLPGVGAFKDGMEELRARGLIEPLRTHVTEGRPFLGICLGMQMLLRQSQEFGEHAGLTIIDGCVVEIPTTGTDGTSHKIPHIGWNELIPSVNPSEWHGTILHGIAPRTSVYFVHSFTAVPSRASHRLADALYGGLLISAVIASGHVYGCQFHPEKSGPAGLKIIENFITLG